jgi:hypothetical protein
MANISVTLDTSQSPSVWLKSRAPKNMEFIDIALDTFQFPIGSLKEDSEKRELKSWILDTSQLPMGQP